MTARNTQLVPLSAKDEVTGLALVETIYEPDDNEKVLSAEVFRHYMALITEKSKQR